jgi:hypothetical protein
MGYKNILFGVISSSLIALASHELTKRYEKNKACELFDEQDDRFLTLKENLDNEIRLKTDENKELRRRTTFLSKKLYHINQIDIVDEIDYITRSNLNKEKKYDAIMYFRSLIEKICKTDHDDELTATLNDIKTFRQDINYSISNKEKEDRDKKAHEIFKKYEAINISGQLNLPDEYKNNIFQIIETKIRLLETISEIKEFSYLKPDIKEINEMRKEPPYLVLSNDLTIRRQIQIDRMLNKLLNPVFYKMKDIIFEYEFNLSNESKKEFDSLIYKTYEILDTDRYLDGEKCFRFFIATYKTICEIIVYNVYASENMDVHKEICSLFNHCNHMMFYLLQDGNISLENYLNNHSEEKDIINKLYKNIK